jgi:ribosome recycling factor
VIRQDAMKENKTIFDAKAIGEDEKNRNEKDIEALTKTANEKVDELVKVKSEEVMKV